MEVEKQIEQSLVVVKNEVATISELKELKITSQETLEQSAEGLKKISAVSKIIKAEKDKNINPAKQIIENVKNFWKPFETAIDEAEMHIKSEQTKWLEKVRKQQQEQEDKSKKELEEKLNNGEDISEALANQGNKIERIEHKADAIKTYTYTGVRITDKAKLPLQYLIPDESAIKKALQSGVAVEGAELYTEERVKK